MQTGFFTMTKRDNGRVNPSRKTRSRVKNSIDRKCCTIEKYYDSRKRGLKRAPENQGKYKAIFWTYTLEKVNASTEVTNPRQEPIQEGRKGEKEKKARCMEEE